MGKIEFIEKSHRYLNEEGRDLISVSKFFERFKPKVDWDEIANNTAKKLTKAGTPTTKAEVLKKWAAKRDISASIGTLYHQIREDELTDHNDFYERSCKKRSCIHENGSKFSIPISNIENNTVYPELIIYDEEFMICGQSDKVIVADNKINIWDYKTDKKIEKEAFSSQWVKPRKLLPPLTHLDDCNFNHYSIKMSLYMYMLWKANKGKLLPGEIVIEHINLKRDPDNDDIAVLEGGKPVVLSIEQIKLPYRKREVVAMLKTLK